MRSWSTFSTHPHTSQYHPTATGTPGRFGRLAQHVQARQLRRERAGRVSHPDARIDDPPMQQPDQNRDLRWCHVNDDAALDPKYPQTRATARLRTGPGQVAG